MNYNYEQFMENYYPEKMRFVRTHELQLHFRYEPWSKTGCTLCAPTNYNYGVESYTAENIAVRSVRTNELQP